MVVVGLALGVEDGWWKLLVATVVWIIVPAAIGTIRTLRRDLLKVSEACGVWHPAMLDADDVEIISGGRRGTPLREIFGYQAHCGGLSGRVSEDIVATMSGTAPRGGSAPPSAHAEG